MFFFVSVLQNSIKTTQTTCTTYPSSAKAAAATSTFPSSLCTTATVPYCDYSASNYYNVPWVNGTSTRPRDENYYPYNHQQKHQHHRPPTRKLYLGNQQDYDDDDDYGDDYRYIRGTDSWTQFDNLLLNLKRMML